VIGTDGGYVRRYTLDQEKKQTPKSAKVVAVLIVAVAVAAIAALVVYGDPARRARRYASRIGDGGNNGALSNKIIDLGTDAALPVALDMLKSDDYLTRRHGIIILGKLDNKNKVRAVLDDVVAAMEKEDISRNRSEACAMMANLCWAKPQYCGKFIQFLKDPDERVRKMALGSFMKVADIDKPALTHEDWIQWWENEKHKYEEKAPAD
jgi:HEAT repeat protein